MRRQRPSATLVIACVALAVAIGGTGMAAIAAIPSGGRFTACYQTSESVLNRIVLLAEPGEGCPPTYARVTWPAESTGGAAGPPGPTGPAGPRGLRGATGPALFSRVRLVTIPIEMRTLKRAVVPCNRGETAISGGYFVRSYQGGVDLVAGSYPWMRKGRPAGWVFEPKRIPLVEGKTYIDYEVKNLYITRQDGHNHAVHYRGTPFSVQIPTRVVNADARDSPLKASIYALCAGR